MPRAHSPTSEKYPVDPVYSQATPNQPIALGTHQVELTLKNGVHTLNCAVEMEFTPKDRLHFHTVSQTGDEQSDNATNLALFDHMMSRSDSDVQIRLCERGVEFDVIISGTNQRNGWTFLPSSSVVTATQPSNQISYITAHLFNFPNFSSPTDEGGSRARHGNVQLIGDGWKIIIAATRETDGACRSLKENGGYVITHAIRIERSDKTTFCSQSARKILECLHYFLSFALGRWSGVAFPVGYSQAEDVVFEEWGLPMSEDGSWNGGLSWFDKNHGDHLANAFPGFLECWSNDLWHEAIRESLYWYVGANESGTDIGVDTGLILCQTALERLAWTYCVKHKKLVSAQAFSIRGLNAADKLRLLVTSLGLPTEIPATLTELSQPPKHISGAKWDDALHAITEIRNAIVHPDAKLSPSHGAFNDAWKLSLWLIELCLLRLCKYNGRYSNRLASHRFSGQVEAVPWTGTT